MFVERALLAVTFAVLKGSNGLNFKDGQIHKNYNGWVDILERYIRGNLPAL